MNDGLMWANGPWRRKPHEVEINACLLNHWPTIGLADESAGLGPVQQDQPVAAGSTFVLLPRNRVRDE